MTYISNIISLIVKLKPLGQQFSTQFVARFVNLTILKIYIDIILKIIVTNLLKNVLVALYWANTSKDKFDKLENKIKL